MSDEAAEDVLARKALRRQAYDARNAQEDKDELSKAIVGTFVALPEYASAQTVMLYIDARSEVPTRRDLSDVLRGKGESWCLTARWTRPARTSWTSRRLHGQGDHREGRATSFIYLHPDEQPPVSGA